MYPWYGASDRFFYAAQRRGHFVINAVCVLFVAWWLAVGIIVLNAHLTDGPNGYTKTHHRCVVNTDTMLGADGTPGPARVWEDTGEAC